jgi:diaminobutyrate-2-oxoglutarate transaminase
MKLESDVKSYSRRWPNVFSRASGDLVWDVEGRRWLDCFGGAGSLNYGHADPELIGAMADYLARGGILHSLDVATEARQAFIEAVHRVLLAPRRLPYILQFPGPTGTNAVECALKIARLASGRTEVVYFEGAYHGMTLGSLSVTDGKLYREGAGVPLPYTHALPFGTDAALDQLRTRTPAAVIVETVQAEGGINVAPSAWLRDLAAVCRERGALLIVDDVQVGCGRTGPFFSFERAGITPDVVCMSKALSGVGLPLSLTLLRPELDVWQPGQHSGTFRGNNLAFVTAVPILERWAASGISEGTERRAAILADALHQLQARHPEIRDVRGLGLIQGLELTPELAQAVARAAWERGLLIETCGSQGQVVKLLPSLTMPLDILAEVIDMLSDSLQDALQRER